ncbi:glycosyltransferase family 39 protein [Bradyrhizobium sp. U87765 SZCCT0131]|uniref:ArnT family glycosyltransferase n=1 Tax=unclassified Bradyrhizobium TaxID=2631580 RepID=UPI001BA981D0|nr:MULTISPECIES: glycosyltransferase family 39 protein [unclassified Bradyrhizobium]MBR1220272.1 glycosyltransferase family 39 protein [Bradyrhizobium sp. U87765 SZCCT0131]MBR1263273.1 glycosyltransferase family 39 protein [Bradyrhizobium sp. U87765 SZCCT0134]MBR1306844.1 glycosyltransferase family 39 protein [Bradyrhizobium sp. U87765 SZCCT0110]MBR1323343.1 glycosyltransferase family 39 protein [Bradyrhizobium sp. U87765 SZCCT0109]MBR1345798.1 glycosyltransferase family 39 protein [Bradyrhizo
MSETLYRPRFGAPREPANRVDPGRGLARIVDVAAGSHARASIFLILIGLLFFLPGFFNIPPIDRDEARFAQATKQMVETGDFVDIRFQDEVRYKKPVGIYWLQAAAVETASRLGLPRAQVRIWLFRIPSLFGAIGAVLLTYWAALAFVTRRGAVLAALMLCGCVLVGVEARLAKTDAVLLCASVAVMGALARIYVPWQRGEDRARPSWGLPAVFWTAIAAGLLVKGPLILMFAALAIAALLILDRNGAWLWQLRPVWGLMWVLVLVLPWFVLIVLKSGGSFFADSIGGDMLNKLASPQESHGAPPGLYFVLFWLTFWPGSALAGLAAPAIWRARREPGAQFLLAWLVPSWIVFEIVMTKLPHYVLPLYPAIAILIIGALERRVLSRTPWVVRGASWWFVVPVAISVAMIVLSIALTLQPAFLAWPFAAGAMIFGLFAWWLYDDNEAERSLLNALAASWFLGVVVYGVVMPSLSPLFPSVELARALRNVECVGPRAAAAGFHEPSLVFMTSTSTLLTDGSGAADFLGQGSCRFALIESRQERAFAARAEAIGLRYNVATRIEGYNYSQGRQVSIAVFRSEGTR